MNRLVCNLRCKIITASIENTFGEVNEETGFFEGELYVSEDMLKRSTDPKAYVNNQIALSLRRAIEETSMPRERWIADFSPWAQKHFNFPETLGF